MKIHTADYIKSAPSLKECPDFGDTPELALVGRSNVGKSSFINSMTQRKNLARTSNTPGKTRYINFYAVTYGDTNASGSPSSGKNPEKLVFVDLPGYGYAKVSHAEQERWRLNLEAYLSRRNGLRGVIQMIDARHGPQDNDIRMFEWLQFHGKRTVVVLTKTDKLNRAERSKNVAAIAYALGLDADVLLSYSAETHHGRDDAWRAIRPLLTMPAAFPE